MAEADSKTPDTEPYLKGSFKVFGALYDVSLSETTLSWNKQGDEIDQTVNVPVEELLYGEKLVETDGAVSGFGIAYMKHMKKNMTKHGVVHFYGSTEDGENWSRSIQETINKVPGRPHKMLVLVNPVSGGSNGRQIYQNDAERIFHMANIETDVIVSERAQHIEEIMATYDLSSIDGIVIVGGDGTYHEVINGLQQRIMKEAGLDINDSCIKLPQIPLPIGLIPAGTGNGIAGFCYGTYDVETAALTIVSGKTKPYSVIGVHSGRELVSYSSFQVGSGCWGDMIYTAETKRHLGILRYPYCIIDTLLIKALRRTEIVIDYLPPADKKDLLENSDIVTEDNEDSPVSDPQWQHYKGEISGTNVFLQDVVPVFDETTDQEESLTLMVSKPCSRFGVLSLFIRAIFQPRSIRDDNRLLFVRVKEYKVKIVSPSDPESETGKKELILNIDGDFLYAKQPEFHVRLHPKTVQLFSKGSQ